MASQVLTAWDTWVDDLGLPAQQAATLKQRGKQLYVAAIREAARHFIKHAEALYLDNPSPPRANMRDFMIAVCQRAINANDTAHLALADTF